ncbi:MAG: hypothetical protein ACTSWN_08630 [Promethearchaeota archaeon]
MIDKIINSLKEYTVILKPDRDEEDWWAGAPSVVFTSDRKIYLAARMRDAISPRGRRGYEIRILKSDDGFHFKEIKRIHKNEAGVHGFERATIVNDPDTGAFKLYGCAEMENGWCIWKLDDVKDPKDFNPASLKKVLNPELPHREVEASAVHHSAYKIEYKDPFIIRLEDQWHMFVIGFDRVERPFHFQSQDGICWTKVSEKPILENTGWHNFFTRPACLLPLEIGYLLVYEGSNINWYDPGYNIATGLAYSLDLMNFIDLTPNEPILKSTTPGQYHTWRYSHWIRIKNEIHVFFEAAKPNNSNEIRYSRFKVNV